MLIVKPKTLQPLALVAVIVPALTPDNRLPDLSLTFAVDALQGRLATGFLLRSLILKLFVAAVTAPPLVMVQVLGAAEAAGATIPTAAASAAMVSTILAGRLRTDISRILLDPRLSSLVIRPWLSRAE